MLSVYRLPRSKYSSSSSSSSSDDGQPFIPAGKPYLTKINGKLVMAREKRPRKPNVVNDLMGEAFRATTQVVHKRAKSVNAMSPPLMIGGIPYMPEQQRITYTTPLSQQGFSSEIVPGTPVAPIAPYQYPNTQYQQHMFHPRRYTVAPQSPTKADFDLLQRIDADYKSKENDKENAIISSAQTLNETQTGEMSKATITVTKHVCSNCGRLRSRKYHMENPIKKGEDPILAFCRKCQRDASSTDGSDVPKKKDESKKVKDTQKKKSTNTQSEDGSPRESAAQKKRKQFEQAQVSVLSSSKISLLFKKKLKKGNPDPAENLIVVEEENVEEIPMPKPKPKPRKKNTTHEVNPTYSYVVEEENYSSEDAAPKGRLRLRFEQSDASRRPAFPQPEPSESRNSRARTRYEHRNFRYKKTDPGRRRSGESLQERALSPIYRYVQPFSLPEVPEPAPKWRGRRYSRLIPQDDFTQPDEILRVSRRVQNTDARGGMGNRQDSFASNDSSRSHSSQRRRRRHERNHPVDVFSQTWDSPHEIQPETGDERVVVTETYVYRPRRDPGAPRDRREPVDDRECRPDARGRDNFSADDHAYYHNDWSQEEPLSYREHATSAPPHRQGYRRDNIQDSELCSEVVASDDVNYDRAYDAIHENLPRAPTPPSPDRSPPPKQHPQHPRRNRTHSASNHRAPFVHNATDGRTAKAVVPSPRVRSFEGEMEREREGEDPFYGELETELNERERMAEREENVNGDDVRDGGVDGHRGRRVTFREEGTVIEDGGFDVDKSEREADREAVTWSDKGLQWGGGGGGDGKW